MARKRPEILAPAGSLDALAAAMAHGADAVYIGVGGLNARVRALSLTLEQLPAMVHAAHARGVKVYVPLNVPLQPDTLEEGVAILSAVHLAGADAVILRDPILMKLVRRHLPDLPVHASTQAGAANVAAARKLQELGCSRVILPRECSLAEIAAIHRALPGLELESFFFGAMCFGISGACLLGEAVGHRSGNYGNCLQACRLPYVDHEGTPTGHPFSMKDLDYFKRIKELVEAGVISLKIEGRLKSPAWVGCVTAWARRAAENWAKGGLTATEYARFDDEVRTLFSRPRTDAFLDGKTDAEDLIYAQAPGHRGLPVAHRLLSEGGRTWLAFTTPVELSVRDGLLLTYKDGAEEPVSIRELRDGRGKGTSIVRAGETVRVPVPRRVEGAAIHSCQAVKRAYEVPLADLDNLLAEAELPVTVTRVTLCPGTLALDGRCGRFTFRASYDLETQPARNEGFGPEQGSRLFPDAEFDCAPGLFVPPSALKKLRRQFRDEARSAYIMAQSDQLVALDEAMAKLDVQFLAPDAELLARGPAAVARVTGLTAGHVATTGGDHFVVESNPEGTVVRYTPKPRD
jgi:putative protease